MVSKVICKDEWYPVLTISDPSEYSFYKAVDIPESLIARYEAAEKAFDEVQDDLWDLMRESE